MFVEGAGLALDRNRSGSELALTYTSYESREPPRLTNSICEWHHERGA